MTKPVYVKHLGIPHQTKKFQAREQARAAANHLNKNQVQDPSYLSTGIHSAQRSHNNTSMTIPTTNTAACVVSTIALITFLGIALRQAYIAQQKQNPKPKKHNRHHLTKEKSKTALEEIQNGTYSFNSIL